MRKSVRYIYIYIYMALTRDGEGPLCTVPQQHFLECYGIIINVVPLNTQPQPPLQAGITEPAPTFVVQLWVAERMHVQDAWDWMVPHWCDRSESIWPVEQINNPKLDLNRPQEYTGAVYTHVMAAEAPGDAYTLRGRHYALLYQSLRGGPDPKHEMDEGRVRSCR